MIRVEQRLAWTVREVAHMFAVSEGFVRKLVRKNELSYLFRGRISTASLVQYLERRGVGGERAFLLLKGQAGCSDASSSSPSHARASSTGAREELQRGSRVARRRPSDPEREHAGSPRPSLPSTTNLSHCDGGPSTRELQERFERIAGLRRSGGRRAAERR